MHPDDTVAPYFQSDFTIQWCLPYELSVICWSTRKTISRCDLNNEREVDKAVALLEPKPLQYDFIVVSSIGAGWTEMRLQLGSGGPERTRISDLLGVNEAL